MKSATWPQWLFHSLKSRQRFHHQESKCQHALFSHRLHPVKNFKLHFRSCYRKVPWLILTFNMRLCLKLIRNIQRHCYYDWGLLGLRGKTECFRQMVRRGTAESGKQSSRSIWGPAWNLRNPLYPFDSHVTLTRLQRLITSVQMI